MRKVVAPEFVSLDGVVGEAIGTNPRSIRVCLALGRG
jgi:hypothetical protein